MTTAPTRRAIPHQCDDDQDGHQQAKDPTQPTPDRSLDRHGHTCPQQQLRRKRERPEHADRERHQAPEDSAGTATPARTTADRTTYPLTFATLGDRWADDLLDRRDLADGGDDVPAEVLEVVDDLVGAHPRP